MSVDNARPIYTVLVEYFVPFIPVWYVCSGCGAKNCKLWRGYNSFDASLMCAKCAAKASDNHDISDMDSEGKHTYKIDDHDMGRSDQIGWYVPAVPVLLSEVETYWGYTSVPEEGVNWWSKLPTFEEQ